MPTTAELRARQVSHAFVTLHVGAGTFAPVRVEDIDAHAMHEEYLEVPEATASTHDVTLVGSGGTTPLPRDGDAQSGMKNATARLASSRIRDR